MARAQIISEIGAGKYTIKRLWAGRGNIQTQINVLNAEIVKLQNKYDSMPESTFDKLFNKNIVKMQIASLQKRVSYLTNNMPDDNTVEAWCADFTEGLTGEVGTIDIAGEYTIDVNIRPGHFDEDERAAEIADIQAEIITAKNDLAAIPKETAAMIAIKSEIAWRTSAWKLMPESTPQEIQAKADAKTIIDRLSADYLNLKTDQDLLIAIADRRVKSLEATIICLQDKTVHYCLARDGDLYPAITLGPWTTLLNQMIYPGWQKFKPLHRYATIIEASIDYENHKCAVAVKPTFSLMNYNVNRAATGGGANPAAERGVKSNVVKNYNVNYGDRFGIEQIEQLTESHHIEKQRTLPFYTQNAAAMHPGFLDFIERYPDHPISNVTALRNPVYLTDDKYIQIARICRHVDYWFYYESDKSGYDVSDHWDVMYDLGDPWYWTPISPKQGLHSPEDIAEIRANPPAQTEFFFGLMPLEYDDIHIVAMQTAEMQQYLQFGTYLESNVNLQYAADQLNPIGPRPKRTGDCEDFVLTKMQMIIEAGILDASNLQVILCYVVNAGYHAVLGIQTTNHGFIISDQRDYGQLWEINQLNRTHHWESFSVATAAGGGTPTAANAQVVLTDVPIEYMDCNSAAFVEGDDVIIEFTDQDWSTPKVVGFESSPQTCSTVYVFPGQLSWGSPPSGPWVEDESRTFSLQYISESWAWKNPFPRDYGSSGLEVDSFSRVGYAAAGENGLGFTVGGRTVSDAGSPDYFDHLDVFDSATETFAIGLDYPKEIVHLIFRSIDNGKPLAYGGWDGVETSYGSVISYTIATDLWEHRSTGEAVHNHASFVIDSVLYIVGGNDGTEANTVYYGADNFGYGYGDYYVDSRGGYSPNQTVMAYNDIQQSWAQKTTCPVPNFVQVKGWNIESKGLVGGGAYTYAYDEYVYAGYDTVEVSPGVWRRVQVHWVHLDIGLQQSDETYLYDGLAETWTKQADNVISGTGNQATATALNESVALIFGLQSPGYTDEWFDYKLSTDAWSDRGNFGLYAYSEPGYNIGTHRYESAGLEL